MKFPPYETRAELLNRGLVLINRWCQLNAVSIPRVTIFGETDQPEFDVCAYYRDGEIKIWPGSCAPVGLAGRRWSYPGYVVDRTPYGVLAHELGHHVDDAAGARGGNLAHKWRKETDDEAITGYHDNTNEWFAEIFRLYVTNPNLLFYIRPKMYQQLNDQWPTAAEERPWQEILKDSLRHLQAASNKIRRAERKHFRQDSLWPGCGMDDL